MTRLAGRTILFVHPSDELYGADLCLAAKELGLASVVLDALCLHNSRNVDLPLAFWASSRQFSTKWRSKLPVATSCVKISEDGRCSTV